MREPLPQQPALHFQGPPFTVPSTSPSSIEGEPPACSHGSNNEALGIPQLGVVQEKSGTLTLANLYPEDMEAG